MTGLRVETRSREVLLWWTPPANCVEVRVVRKLLSAPIGVNDGTPVASLRDSAHDRGLVDDKVYHYGVFTLYRTADGRLISSRGAYISAAPAAPVAIVLEPSLSRAGDGPLHISWPPQDRGEVQVFRSLGPIPHTPGDRIEKSRGRHDGGGLATASVGQRGALDRNPPAGESVCYTSMIARRGLVHGRRKTRSSRTCA